MSKFECPVVRVEIEPHPNADAIEVAVVGGFRSIVKKGQFQHGDLAVYIPEFSLLPEWLLKKMGFWDDLNSKGTLSTAAGNRVRAMKLRGVLSQGLLVAGNTESERGIAIKTDVSGEYGDFAEGEDAAEFLGITKWEPPIPQHFGGQMKVMGGDMDATFTYDFENIKKHLNIFDDGEQVVFTEKIHGTQLQIGLIPKSIWEGKAWADKVPALGDWRCVVTSKGLSKRGILLDATDETNLYASTAQLFGLWEKLAKITEMLKLDQDQPVFMVGEIFGVVQTVGGPKGIQDLTYGSSETKFQAFDIYTGPRYTGRFLTYLEFTLGCHSVGIPMAPVLYIGPYSYAKVLEHTSGNTVLTSSKQIREGIVIKSATERPARGYTRRIAKSVSDAYLLRKDATEYV